MKNWAPLMSTSKREPAEGVHVPSFSLKTMFIFVSVAGLACFALATHSFAVAITFMLCVALSLVLITVYSVWARKPRLLVLIICSIAYLIVADGGLFPSAVQWLPTEWSLQRCSRTHTHIYSGLKRHNESLTRWALQLCWEPNHNDWDLVFGKKFAVAKNNRPKDSSSEITDATLDLLLVRIDSQEYDLIRPPSAIVLPTFKVTPTTQVIFLRHRDQPQNRAFFISGHCLAVLLTLAVVMLLEAGVCWPDRNAIQEN